MEETSNNQSRSKKAGPLIGTSDPLYFERKRLDALRSYDILDSIEEKDYDDLTALASTICQMPISIISMVDEHRQWFKSHHGLNVSETPIEHSICTHAIASNGPIFVVPDATRDKRFSNTPLVTGDPHITFYAGVPLINKEGFALGSLCVIDHQPRVLSDVQQKALIVIAKQVIDKLELRRKINELNQLKFDLENSLSKLKQSDFERKDFITNISHDLRTPLAIAKGYTETLLLQEDLSGESVGYLQLVDNKIQQVDNLVTQLFELSKMESVEFEAQREPFVIGEVLKEIINSWYLPASDKNISLDCSGCETSYMIFADVSMMERVINNLLGNALKFTPQGGEIHVDLLKKENDLLLNFTNNGSLLPEDVFQWISTGTTGDMIVRRPVRSGLGLAIVKRILELHDYTLLVTTGTCNSFLIRMTLHHVGSQT